MKVNEIDEKSDFFLFESEIVLPRQREVEEILCQHCGRTAENGIRCMGKCVADSDY